MARTNPNLFDDPFHPNLSQVLNDLFGPTPRTLREQSQPEDETPIFNLRNEEGNLMFVSLDASGKTGYHGDFEILNGYPRLSTDPQGKTRTDQLKNLEGNHNVKYNLACDLEKIAAANAEANLAFDPEAEEGESNEDEFND